MHKDMKKMVKSYEKLRGKYDDVAGSEKAVKMLEIVAMLVSHRKFFELMIRILYQGSHRLEKYLNLEGFLENSLKTKYALKSTGKSFKGLVMSLNSSIICGN